MRGCALLHNTLLTYSQYIKFCIFPVLLLFVIYNLTICPTIYWRDSSEFINVAYSFGIAHPAGFPSYSLISKIFTFLPISNIAMRVNYVSLFFAVLTCWIIFHVILNLIYICYKPDSNNKVFLSAAFGTLILGGAYSYWWIATISEVYSMNCFFLSAFFLIAFKWQKSGEPRYLLLAAFVFGLSTAVYGANLLFVPALFIYYFLTNNKKPLNYFFLTAVFFLLGYSIYLYLPVRSLTNPAFDWGNTETFKQFLIHITDKKDSGSHFRGVKNIFSLYKNFEKFIQIMIEETTLVGFFLTIAGAFCHFKKDKKSFFLLASIGLINTTFFLTSLSEIAKNGSLFLTSFIVFTFWIGLGIYMLTAETSGYIKGMRYKNIITPVIISFIVFSFVKDYSYNDKSSYYLSRDHSREMYSDINQNALIFTGNYWFIFRYFKDVENLRSDVSIILYHEIIRPSLFNKVVSGRFPLLKFPVMESKKENQHKFVQLLISENISYRPIYTEIKRDYLKYNYQYLIPENKFLMRFSSHTIDRLPDAMLNEFIIQLKVFIEKELNDEQLFLDQEMGIRSYYETFFNNFADYLMLRKRYYYAASLLEFAATIANPDSLQIPTKLGLCYLNMGNYNKAEKAFTYLFDKNKESYTNNYNLASLYFRKNDINKSKRFLKNAIKLNKDYFESYFLSGLIYAAEGNYYESMREINFAISKSDFKPDKRKMKNALKFIKNLEKDKKGSKIEEGEFVKMLYPGFPLTGNAQDIN